MIYDIIYIYIYICLFSRQHPEIACELEDVVANVFYWIIALMARGCTGIKFRLNF